MPKRTQHIRRTISFVIAPGFILYLLFFGNIAPESPKVTYTLCIGLLMAVWWITEIVPLAVTSLLPVALFPLFGIMDGKVVSAAYFNDVIFLFMGGFLVALAMQRWNLHRRIALHILRFTGVSPPRILLGFMLASSFLSMWISNTATAMMMLPIAFSIIQQLESMMQQKTGSRFSIGLLLGIAYSASIGGMATLVGTPPNLSFVRIFHIYFPEAPEISFSLWMIYALPVVVILFSVTWMFLLLMYKPRKGEWTPVPRLTFTHQLQKLGKRSHEEGVVMVVFVLLALLWMTRADITFNHVTLYGWAGLFPESSFINDGTTAVFMALVLFVIPSRNEKGKRILDWNTASEMPWHILLLFGGGFALASGFKESGLSIWFGEQLIGVSSLNPFLVILSICLIVTFLTELTSNTATTEMVLPILAGIAGTSNINPLLLMIPATMSASMAFMLPVATPPNAIIFGTNRITIAQMARTGLILNLIGALVISGVIYLFFRL
jgi:solute carrier family 13 (sodium-dependent dicarboxylate transporter), member 2/3/5